MRERTDLVTSFIILPIDAFSGKPITDPDFCVQAAGEKKPLVKADGYRVFMKAQKNPAEVALFGTYFQTKRITVPLAQEEGMPPVLTVFVLPDRSYPFPPGTAFLEGKRKERAALEIAGDCRRARVKLRLDAVQGERRIALYQQEQKNLSGRTFLLTDPGKGGPGEWVKALSLESLHSDLYLLEEALQYPHAKIGTHVIYAQRYEAGAAEKSYFAAFPSVRGEAPFFVYGRLKARDESRESVCRLKAGGSQTFDFL